jgi:hypothetical protein
MYSLVNFFFFLLLPNEQSTSRIFGEHALHHHARQRQGLLCMDPQHLSLIPVHYSNAKRNAGALVLFHPKLLL